MRLGASAYSRGFLVGTESIEGHGAVLVPFFAAYRCRLHVVSKTEVGRMAQAVVVGPFGELHLSDQGGLYPMWCVVGGWRRHVEWGLRRGERPQQRHQLRELLFIEPAADVAYVDEFLILVHTEQQSPEMRPGSARTRPAADHELLRANQLQFRPVAGPFSRVVTGIRALGNQSFPTSGNRLTIELASIARRLRREPEQRRSRVAEDALESRAARGQRQAAQIVLAFAKQIERDERDRRIGGGLRWRFHVNAALQVLETHGAAAIVERHDLAVDQERRFELLFRKSLELSGDLWKLCGLVVAEPRVEAHGRTRARGREGGQRPDTVVLRLVNEIGAAERDLDGRGQHGLNDAVTITPGRRGRRRSHGHGSKDISAGGWARKAPG